MVDGSVCCCIWGCCCWGLPSTWDALGTVAGLLSPLNLSSVLQGKRFGSSLAAPPVRGDNYLMFLVVKLWTVILLGCVEPMRPCD